MSVEPIQDREEIRTFLMADRLANAYLLGNLDPKYLPFCRWYGDRTDEGKLDSILCHYSGLSLPAVFMVGAETSFESLLRECRDHLPDRFHFHVGEERMTIVKGIFEPTSYERMIRMGLERGSYERPKLTNGQVDRLGHRDTASIMDLYQHYPDHFFEPYQLETGLYFGVRDPSVGLASIAGIHVFSEEHDVAVIGNFVTHPARRGAGLASACTARLLDALFEKVSFVALNVQEGNEPAIGLYSKFGFEKNNVYYEGRVESV